MPTALEQYRAWERSGPFVHVMIIDRGDNSPANRLTLTDRPYYDKGVAGVKYHDTYPAPIHCIISEIVTDEQMGGTSYADIVVTNATGRLDSLLHGRPIVQGHRFTILRGNPAWSLMQTDYPERFLEIFVGQIDAVSARRGGNELVLRISPIRYKLDNYLGAPGQPIAFGKVLNVPAVLDDSAVNRWRFNTRVTNATLVTTADLLAVRDNGAPLTLTTDYVLVNEDGVWQGLIELVGAGPYGQLTADLNVTTKYVITPADIARQVITDYLVDGYALEGTSLDMSARGSNPAWMLIKPDGSKLYYYDSLNGIFQYTLAAEISAATYDSVSFDPGDSFKDAWISPDGEVMYLVKNSTLYLYEMSVPWDITTLTLDSSLAISSTIIGTGSLSTVLAIELNEDESRIWLLTLGDTVYQADIPVPRTLSGLTKSAELYLGRLPGVIFPPSDATLAKRAILRLDGGNTFMFGLGNGQIVQLTLPVADDLSDYLDPRREYITRRGTFHQYHSFCLHPDGDRLYWLTDAKTITQIDLPEPGNLPPRVLSVPWGVKAYNSDLEVGQPAGICYQSQVQIGAALRDTLGAVGLDFTVSRYGEVLGTMLFMPTDNTDIEVYDIAYSDFLGERQAHIEHTETLLPARKVTINYRENYTVQSRASLAGTVTDANADFYSRRFGSTLSLDAAMSGYVDPEELVFETKGDVYLSSGLVSTILSVRQQERRLYRLRCQLGAITTVRDFRIGSVLRAADDWRRRDFEAVPHFRLDQGLGGLLSCASVTANNVTGDITVLVRFKTSSFVDMTGGRVLMCKARLDTGVRGSWAFLINTDGKLAVWASADGTTTKTELACADTLESFGLQVDSLIWAKVTLDLSDGSNSVANFFYSQVQSNDRPAAEDWVHMETVTGPIISGIFATTAHRIIAGAYRDASDNSGYAYIERISRAILESGIDGTPVADMDARRAREGDSTFDSSVSGNIWDSAYWPASPALYRDGRARMLVTGERINWTKQQREITVFR